LLAAANQADRRRDPSALLYIDLDGFKPINDRYGHQVGDETLQIVAKRLRQSTRKADTCARLGGDEFAILFVRANHIPARERARNMLAELNSLQVKWKSKFLAVRASMGLANYDADTGFEDLFARADRAMYREKRQSR